MPQRGARAAVLKERLIQIVGVFGEIRLPYMVIGAFALAAWGRPRATLDLDFMIQTAELPKAFVRKLGDLGFQFDTEWERYNPMIRAFHKRFRSGRIPVDVLLNRDEHDLAAFARRKRKRVDDRYIWFPSPEDLLLQKVKVGRAQDFVDATGIVERMRGDLDWRYVARWAKKLHLTAEIAYVSSDR